MDRIEQVYCTYCKRHQDVINALNHAQQSRAEVQSFLKVMTEKMTTRRRKEYVGWWILRRKKHTQGALLLSWPP